MGKEVGRVASAVLLSLLLVWMFALSLSVSLAEASGIVYIRADGSVDPLTAPIVTADNVTYFLTDNIANQTVVVERSNIVVDGQNYELEGSGVGCGFELLADNVTIRNTTISDFYYGIYLEYYSGLRVAHAEDNIIANNTFGLYLVRGSSVLIDAYCSIYRNVVSNISIRAIYLDNQNAKIVDNTIVGGHIVQMHSTFPTVWATITNNTLTNCSLDLGPARCVLRLNTIVHGGLSAWDGWYDLDVGRDIDTSNTINGQPIIYWRNQANRTVPFNAGYVVLLSCENITVENLILRSNGEGIALINTSDCEVKNNSIVGCTYGVIAQWSSDNRIHSNNITNCGAWPLVLFETRNNTICHNNFIGYVFPPMISYSQDLLDDGYPSGGNYWSGYTGTDTHLGLYQNLNGPDGIGDTPYIIAGSGDETNYSDCYPLTQLWTPSWSPIPPLLTGDLNYDGSVNIFDVVLVAAAYGSMEGEPRWNPMADLAQQFGVIDIFDVVVIAGHYGETYQ
jgi:parallel beta-helix repeat protein